MNDIWFTSDQHYNHAAVIRHMKRPFDSIEDMNEALISNHNEVVKPGDRVYNIGDFAWHDHNRFLARLTGQQFLVKGNHDHIKRLKEPLKFAWVKDTVMVKYLKDLFFLSHYAHRVWPQSNYGSYHLYGHSHGMIDSEWGRSMDIGVDAHKYYPVSLDQVLAELSGIQEYMNHHPEEVV